MITQRRSAHFEHAGSEATRYLKGTLPNGLAFARNGDFLISNFGTDCLELMSRDGASRVLADDIDGEPIGKVNFVLRDSRDRIWITVSTRLKNWMEALRTDLADGYVARLENGRFRIVADGFHFTNEIRFDANEEYLYVVETTGGCITRLRIDERGNVSNREIFGPSSLGRGAWPDGIAFDSAGNLWGTLVYSDKLFVLTPDGDMRVLLDEGDPARCGALEEAFFNNTVDRRRAVRHRARHCAVDGERDIWRTGPEHRVHRLAERHPDPVFPGARSRAADGALEREAIGPHLVGLPLSETCR